MKWRPYGIALSILAIVVVGSVWWFVVHPASAAPTKPAALATTTPTSTPSANATPTASPSSTPTSTPTPTPSPKPTLVPPIADFTARITKKPFGIYVTPTNSPVQPERFTGYHTGDDVEYGDVTADVPVYAVVDAKVTLSEWVSGYGGLLVLHGSINGTPVYILYGHMRQSSLPAVGTSVTQGEQVGVLGTAYSHETDGERRNLHFAIYLRSPVDIRGYVPNKADLAAWADPLSYYQ